MIQVNVHEAKTTLSALLVEVEKGEEVVIARNGVPVAKLVPYTVQQRRFGVAEGTVSYIADDFDAPLEDFKDYM